jgi:NAD kinase
MNRQTQRKIVVITRRTRLDDLLYRHNTIEQARFYVESLGADFDDYVLEDRVYKEALVGAESLLAAIGRVQLLERIFLPNFVFGKEDLIIVIGQDGLVANTLKYIPERPVIAVNPDPDRYDGLLLPFLIEDLTHITQEVMRQQRSAKEITMAKARLSDGQSLLAVNDLFIGPERHTSARYTLEVDGISEYQSSSGVIISTGLGSTGWFKSILTGASAVAKSLGNSVKDTKLMEGFAWDSDSLFYSVREPFPSHTTGTELVFGQITNQSAFTLTSAMPSEGVIFSDGLLEDAISFNSGLSAKVSTADEKGLVVV